MSGNSRVPSLSSEKPTMRASPASDTICARSAAFGIESPSVNWSPWACTHVAAIASESLSTRGIGGGGGGAEWHAEIETAAAARRTAEVRMRFVRCNCEGELCKNLFVGIRRSDVTRCIREALVHNFRQERFELTSGCGCRPSL